MKILQIVNWYGQGGGVENYVHDLSLGLESAGHETVIAYDGPALDLYSFPGRAEHAVPGLVHRRLAADPAVAKRIREIIEIERPDVAYVHTLMEPAAAEALVRALPTIFFNHTHNLYCPAGSKLLQRSGHVCHHSAGLVCMLEAFREHCNTMQPGPLIQSYLRFLAADRWARRIEGVLVDTKFMRGQLVARGYDADRITVLPTPVRIPDTSESAPTPASPPVVLFVGRLTPHKGLGLLLDAVRVAKLPYRLLVAGDGYQRSRLTRLSKMLELAGLLRYVGWLGWEEMHRLYYDASVVVVPSVWPEPFGMVGPEAMAHGRPVVAFAVGGIPEWLEDRVTGYLVPPLDVAALADRIDRLVGDPALARRMGEAGRARAAKAYRLEDHVAALIQVFERAITKRAGEGSPLAPLGVAH